MKYYESITITHPDLLLEWDYEENDLDPAKITCGSNIKVWWVCLKKKHKWQSSICTRTKGSKCPLCVGTNLLLTIEFIREFLEKFNQTLLSDKYVNGKQKLSIKCNTCDLIYKKAYIHCKSGKKVCPRCEGFIKYTHEDVKKIIENNGDELLSIFKNMRQKITIKCGTCDTINTKILKSYLDNHKCSTCTGCAPITFVMIKQLAEIKEDILLTKENEFVNGTSDIKIKCGTCNYIYITCWNTYKNHSCRKCAGSLTLEHDEINQCVQKRGDTLISKNVQGTRNKVDIKCGVCNEIFNVCVASYRSGTGCNICNMSRGERAILNYLKTYNYKFEHNKMFDDCKNIRLLPFDFYIDNKFLIEFDGKQHFEKIEYLGGEKDFEARKKNDIIKTKYCLEHNIPLLRISYDCISEINLIMDIYLANNTKPSLLTTNKTLYAPLIEKIINE